MTKFFSLHNAKEVHLASGKKVIPAKEFSKLMTSQEIVKMAKEDAEQLKQEIAADAEKIKEDAFQQGFQEGLVSLNKHILSLDHELKTLRSDIQKKILPLAITAARKILGEELKMHPDRIVDIVLNSLKPVTQHRRIVIYVNRADLQTLEDNRPKIKKIFEHVENLSIQERDDIEPGGCMIETEAGIINAQLENQWRALESAFESFKGNFS
ncbi:MAG TPA: HrpE/YscL family type III secretion apparatus protein [Chlamydiales bacterium]|nr:HrpE/YscL family type III secretion apparatus protein [Chlamydiales bacterium]